MGEVQSSTAASVPAAAGASAAPPPSGGETTTPAFGSTFSDSAGTGAQARTHAVLDLFQPSPLAPHPARQLPPLFRDGPIDLSDSAGASWTASAPSPSVAPTASTAPALSDPAEETSEAAQHFDEFIADEPRPEDVRRFFESLSPAERQRLADERPETIGSLDGTPASLRNRANRRLMEQDLERLEAVEAAGTLTRQEYRALENVRAMQRSIAKIERETDRETGEPLVAQLYAYDPFAFDGDGRAALAVGNLDSADHLAVAVPGMSATVGGMTARDALNIYGESRRAGGDSVAVIDWVGYDAPSGGLFDGDVFGVIKQPMARAGAQVLVADVAGLRAMRGEAQPHLTVIGHSYGSTTAVIAAHEFGLDAQDLISLASPGAGRADDASDLTTGRDNTWVGSASRDWVTSLGVTGWMDPSQILAGAHGIPPELLGVDPAEDDFYAKRFQAEHVDRGNDWNIGDHLSLRYYDENSESLYNVAAIVTGNYEKVRLAAPRRDPWYSPLQDPERKRVPQELNH